MIMVGDIKKWSKNRDFLCWFHTGKNESVL